MRSKVIVLMLKHFGYGAYLVYDRESKYASSSCAVRAVKMLVLAILRRLTGLNKLTLNLLLFSP